MESQESKIFACQKCEAFGPIIKSTHVFVGESFDGTVVIGESPHKSWNDGADPFSTPSGNRIVEYLKILEKKTENVVLLEAAKCICTDRKNLELMMKNCESFLLRDLNECKPKLIISIGSKVCERISEMWERGMQPCNKYDFKDITFIPLFHSSPINPKNHERNFKFLKELAGK